MNKPVYLGQAILDLNKIVMYEFHYDYMVPKYGENLKLCYMDTDSLVYHIKTEDNKIKLKSTKWLELQFERICKNFLRVVIIILTSIVIFPLSSQSPVCNIATYLTKSTCYIYFIFDWSNTHFGHFSN